VSANKNLKNRNLVILFGYNRIEMLRDRLEELKEIAPPNLLVSVDFLNEKTSIDVVNLLNKYSIEWPKDSILKFNMQSENLGMVQHIVGVISDSLETYDSVIIVEDDISISRGFYKSALNALNHPDFNDKYFTFGGYSPIALPKPLEKFNTFRPTPYFSSWGWAISRLGWQGYKFDISEEDIDKSLSNSCTWKDLSRKQQEIWINRFRKIQNNPTHTWDTQLQYHLFVNDKQTIVPIGRLVENLGFGDFRSAHTKNSRPRWMGTNRYSKGEVSQMKLANPVSRIFVKYESLTVVGDNPLLIKLRKLGQWI
jgi:hypothetical protein